MGNRRAAAHRGYGVRAGRTGVVLAAWPLTGPVSVCEVAERSLALRECVAPGGAAGVEVRGGIGVGVIDGNTASTGIERWVERLALGASAGQLLVSDDLARQLTHRFELSPAGGTSRWSLPLADGHRTLVSKLTPTVLPSAVNGDPAERVLGRANERRRLLRELSAVAAERRRHVVLVSAPAGGGKSYLLRRVLADCDLTLAAGVVFPPLGGRPLDPVRALLGDLGDWSATGSQRPLGEALAEAATHRGRLVPCVIVIDDVHWASPEALKELVAAIADTAEDAAIAWVLSIRTASLESASELVELTDQLVELPPLVPIDREKLLAARLGTLPDALRRHVTQGAARGNPLYLDHLANLIGEGLDSDRLPGTLHEAVLSRLDGLAERVRELTRWSNRSVDAKHELQELEREVGDWLDRLETSDIGSLATIGRYLARLRSTDVELVIARSILGMPVASNRRLASAVERLAAASTDALLEYLETVAADGKASQPAHEAESAAGGAERALRLADAERLLSFASRHPPDHSLARRHGDVALALGRGDRALTAYQTAAAGGDQSAQLQRAMARAEALLGHVDTAMARLQALAHLSGTDPQVRAKAELDLARLHGQPSSSRDRPATRDLIRRIQKAKAWTRVGDPAAATEVARSLVLAAGPAACAAELVESAALVQFAGLTISGLDRAAVQAAHTLGNPHAQTLMDGARPVDARHMFLHWDV